MAIWGWSLLAPPGHSREWHKVRAVQNLRRPGWARFYVPCDIGFVDDTNVASDSRWPSSLGGWEVCQQCRASAD
jgi:hypothetical protein